MESKSNTCVIILAAGLATRLQPFSNKIPKSLIDINGKTLLSRIISTFKEAGFKITIATEATNFTERHVYQIKV